jgi:glycosyltransferase involved in cell wall biosynthesis
MGSKQPAMSFLTPTFHKPHLLRRAVESLRRQTCPDWEMVISPDDGADYSELRDSDPRIRLVDPQGQSRTGPGAARNKALAYATGEFVSCLDDDDTVDDNFVEVCLKALENAPAVVVPSVYVTSDLDPIRTVAQSTSHLDIPQFADLYATVHVSCRRGIAQPWTSYFAEDVLHTCAAIDSAGGRIDVASGTAYRITVHTDSVCATRPDIRSAYEQLLERIDQGQLLSDFSARGRSDTRDLFSKRLLMQQHFEQRADPNIDYQNFVMRR